MIEDRVYIHDIVAPDLLGDRLLAEVKDVRASFDGVAVAGLGWERRRGPRAGSRNRPETAALELGSDVRYIVYDATGTWLLYTTQTASCGGPAEAAADQSPGRSWPRAGQVPPVR